MSKMQANNKRRNFMRAIGGGSLAALVTLLSGRGATAADSASSTTEATPAPKGYRLSEHVRAYYRTTRI